MSTDKMTARFDRASGGVEIHHESDARLRSARNFLGKNIDRSNVRMLSQQFFGRMKERRQQQGRSDDGYPVGTEGGLLSWKPLLAEIQVVPFNEPADAEYRKLRTALEAAGKMLGANDLLIADHANAAEPRWQPLTRISSGLACCSAIERNPMPLRGSDCSDIAPALSIGLDSRSGRRPYDVIPRLAALPLRSRPVMVSATH